MTDSSQTPAQSADLPYRECAGVVVFNAHGEVFVGKRADAADGAAGAWQLPQGGIDRGEDPIDAALRELYEETSIRSVSILTAAPDWIKYDLPDALRGKALKGKYRGQTQRWFAVLFEGEEDEIDVKNPGGGEHPAEFSEWRWAPLNSLPDLIVDFKRDAYLQIVDAFADVPRQLAELLAGSKNHGPLQ